MAIPPVEIHPHLITFGGCDMMTDGALSEKMSYCLSGYIPPSWNRINGPLWPRRVEVSGGDFLID
jgi:hypothetical protein